MSMRSKGMIWVGVAALVAAGFAGWWLLSGPAEAAGEAADGQPVRRLTVALSAAEQHTFESVLRVQGDVRSKYFAEVPSRIFGTLDAVMVDEGDVVTANVTPLFQVDRANLARAVLVSEQDLAVARCAFDEGVVLATRRRIRRLLEGAGGTIVASRYVLFFPIDRALARSVEARLGWLPMGAQHCVAARPGR